MPRPAVLLAEALNRLFPPLEMHRELSADKLSVEAYQAREYEEARRLTPEFGPRWAPAGKHLLDVGSGLGGKPAYYIDQGAASVTGIDIRPLSLKSSTVLAAARPPGQLRLALADGAHMPFPGDCFDIIVSINVLEHVDDLAGVLAECRRVLRPDGLMFFHFPPFFSPWGAHLEGWVNFPWPHVFFSDRSLIEVARRVEAGRRNNDRYIPSAQVNWATLERLPDLNRATARQVLRLFETLQLDVVEARWLPFGRHFLARRGWPGRAALSVLSAAGARHPLREVITTKMALVLARRKGA